MTGHYGAPGCSWQGARLEQGNKSGARADLKRLREIRPEQPQDRALIHGTVGSLLQHLGEHREAEVEYLAALKAWEGSGRGETVDTAAVLTSLATLLIEDRRVTEARRSVDRAAAIFSQSKNAAPMDHSKLLMVRGSLHARRHQWPDAEWEPLSSIFWPTYEVDLLTHKESANEQHSLWVSAGR